MTQEFGGYDPELKQASARRMFPAPFIVVVDANLLYPFTVRDTVLRAAAAGFFQLRC